MPDHAHPTRRQRALLQLMLSLEAAWPLIRRPPTQLAYVGVACLLGDAAGLW